MKLLYFVFAALLCTALWGHCGSLSKQDMQNAADLERVMQKGPTDNLHMQTNAFSESSITKPNKEKFIKNQTQPHAKISTEFTYHSKPLTKVGKVFVQSTETRSSKSSPEPGTIFLLGLGMAGMIFITRQRMKW